MPAERVILAPVSDNEDCLRALDWALKEVYRPGDRFYLLHVVSKRPLGSGLFLSSQPGSPGKLQEMLELEHAKSWIEDRFVPVLTGQDAEHKVLIEKNTSISTIGEVICQKAEELEAALVVLPALSRGSGLSYSESNITQQVVANCHSAVLAWRSSE